MLCVAQDVLDTGGSEEHHYLHEKVCLLLPSLIALMWA
jgi:hypothetical protein